jgi:hypothetical protein
MTATLDVIARDFEPYQALTREWKVETHLRVLRLLPDQVVLDVAGRDLVMSDSRQCLCGWALRASMALASGGDPADDKYADECVWGLYEVPDALARRYGGTVEDWALIFGGVASHLYREAIEEAFTLRLLEAVNGTTPEPAA